ncbi:hypothetical protein TTHT_1020 [Thermotomaculum hydrothermale]|uniref:Uncharacterized protein n=1 Tax=Thermotomaculum hydrothermale TaxID=981385 RepID=A0A7R6SYE7_9BACT|nr:hypothetical protein [Thermotomaculum hydrothermale]BBB32560.1 hypothetical protein TTHT_1020 [Thermotomaculum hydrothermale]
MEAKKDLILQFINFKLDKLISEFKIEIEKIFQKDFYISEEEIEPLINKILAQTQGASNISTSIDPLYNLNLALKNSTNQKELIENFFSSLFNLTNYIGFFIFKGNNAICYAAKGQGNKPQKDFKINKIIFMEPKKLSDPIFPDNLKAFFNLESTIAIPLLIKYKQAGFFIFELNNKEDFKLFEIATSMFERELNLLPLKNQEDIKTQQFKTVEQPPKTETPSTPSKAEEDPVMKKAKRFVNALASDIKLYNEEKIKEGLEKGNLKELLKEDIEKSYQAFREKYPDKNKFPDSLFEEALIKYVAKGNPDLLK